MQNKQQEFLKQREKLKYVTQNNIAKKALDPDIMIEQLMSDKGTFKFNVEPSLPYAVPKWLKVENNMVPAVYEQVWQAVKLGPTFEYCNTKIITHLFTTSGLSLEKLGYLWSLTNVFFPGVLTQQELYIMLALIALVQTGYHVHDIVILNSINHPILPQLDYSFLNITVANPAINRNAKSNDVKPNHSIIFNGISSLTPSNSVPLHVKPLNECVSLKQPPKNVNTFSNMLFNVESLKNSSPILPAHSSANVRKSDMDVTFALPERNKMEVNLNFAPRIPVSELDVDLPIPSFKEELKLVPSKMKPTIRIVSEERKVDLNGHFKDSNVSNYDFLSVNSMTNSLEPRSLDLPMFSETVVPPDEDEFTEFQSATLATVDEYSDFQSASPIAKYEHHNLSDSKLQSPLNFNVSSVAQGDSQESNFMRAESLYHKTSAESDKYDVFRALMEPYKEEKVESQIDTRNGDADDDDDVDDLEDEEFGDFYTADVKQNEVKRSLSMKDKCLEACLRLLQEGLRIFSSITNEQTIKEVLSDEKGCRYFCQLKIVYDTSQRFQRQFESTELNDAIQSTWARLSKYTKYISNEDLLDEIPSENDVDATPCKLCKTKCDVNCVRYAGHNYHVTCINLFLHFVEDSEITAMLNI